MTFKYVKMKIEKRRSDSLVIMCSTSILGQTPRLFLKGTDLTNNLQYTLCEISVDLSYS